MTDLCSRGHVASARALARMGVSRRAIRSMVDRGVLLRTSRGRYACAHLDAEVLGALRAGCALDCVTALARNGVWSGIARNGTHLRAEPDQHLGRVLPGTTVHWARRYAGDRAMGEVSPIDALLQAMRCLTPADALACLESAMHVGYLDEEGLVAVLRLAPRRMRTTLSRLDLGAQSGLETHARLRLVDAGHRVRTQVRVGDASPLDLLVDECVGIETDGQEFHGVDRFLADRTKDIAVEGHGIRMLRIASPHVFGSWPRTLATIERMVEDAARVNATSENRSRRGVRRAHMRH